MYSLGWQPVIQPILASKSLKKPGRQKKEHLANVLDLKQQEREVMVSTVRSEITFFFPACVENIFRTLRCYLATALHKIMQRMRPTNRRTEAERAQSPVWAAGQEPWAHPAKLTAGWAGDSSSCHTLTLLGVPGLSAPPDSEWWQLPGKMNSAWKVAPWSCETPVSHCDGRWCGFLEKTAWHRDLNKDPGVLQTRLQMLADKGCLWAF